MLGVESAADLAAYFDASEFAATAIYREGGKGEEATVTVLLSQPDQVGALDQLRVKRETTTLIVRVSEVPRLEANDSFDIVESGERFIVQGTPLRDMTRLIWSVDVRRAR